MYDSKFDNDSPFIIVKDNYFLDYRSRSDIPAFKKPRKDNNKINKPICRLPPLLLHRMEIICSSDVTMLLQIIADHMRDNSGFKSCDWTDKFKIQSGKS